MNDLELKEFVESFNLPKNEILFLHVRLKGISNTMPYDLLSKKIIDLIDEVYTPKTILVPTFTYNYTKTGLYDRINSPAEVGRFSEEIRKQYSFTYRTLNPVFNVIDTKNYFRIEELEVNSAFGERSLLQLLHEEGHVVVNINVDKFISTYLHFMEYHHDVPYRYIKNFPGKIIVSEKEEKPVEYKYHVRDLEKNTAWDRIKIKDKLYKQGGLEINHFKEVEISWSHSKQMEKILGAELKKNKNFLLGK